MRTLFCSAILIFLTSIVSAQNDTTWTKCFGGSGNEVNGIFVDGQALVKQMTDSTIVLVSNTSSSDGMMSGNNGAVDVFITKLNMDGDTIWTRLLGGTEDDMPTGLDVDNAGNIAICGYTWSTNGDFSGHHGDSLEPDGFIALLDTDGNTTWAYQYGGSNAAGIVGNDYLYDIHFRNNGEIIAVGETSSINGDLSFILDVFTCGWFLKVNAYGTIMNSSKVYSGIHDEWDYNEMYRIIELSNNRFVGLGVQMYSLTPQLWIAEFDNYGNRSWEKIYSPATAMCYPSAIVQDGEGGFIAISTIYGDGGDVDTTFNGGNSDAWIIRTDSVGNIVNQHCFGGSAGELAYGLETYNNEYFLLGSSSSSDGYAPGDTINYANFWVVRFNNNLDTMYTMRFGGSQPDKLMSAAILNNQELFVAGSTLSNDLFVHGNNGGKDIYLARLTCIPTGIQHYFKQEMEVYPNPASTGINIDLFDKSVNYEIFNINGQLVQSGKTSAYINIEDLNNGLFILRVLDENNVWQSATFIKQ